MFDQWRSITVAVPATIPRATRISQAWDSMGRIVNRRYPGCEVSAMLEDETTRGATVYCRFAVLVGYEYKEGL